MNIADPIARLRSVNKRAVWLVVGNVLFWTTVIVVLRFTHH